MSPRAPDFLVIGVMKAGTTTLFRWLQAHPGVGDRGEKEPRFFSDDRNFPDGSVDRRRLASYRDRLGGRHGELTGEASVDYTFPEHADRVSARIAEVAPETRLVAVLRDPVDRLRSHYRYAVQRALEDRPLAEAVGEHGNPYVARSEYSRCLRPYVERFDRSQLLVVRTENLSTPDAPAWFEVLEHLGLDAVPAPTGSHNVTSERGQLTPLARRLADHGILRRAATAPGPIRRMGRFLRPLIVAEGSNVDARLDASRAPLPAGVSDVLAADADALAVLLHWDAVPWDPTEI